MAENASGLRAEIVTTGTEILLGEIVDTNAAWIAQQLRDVGVNLYYKTTVGDNEERLRGVLELASQRSHVIIVSGGLGPTVDDITRQAIAAATGRPLVVHPPTLEKLRERFAKWGTPMTDNNQQQALIPEGALLIDNPVGTAPGFIVERELGTIIALPGVPREMKHLMSATVLPYLRQRSQDTAVIRRRVLRTVGIGESSIDAQIQDLMHSVNPTVGLAAHTGQTDVRITARGTSIADADRLLDEIEAQLRARIGAYIYTTAPEESIEVVVARLLQAAGASVALLESNTGGQLGRRLAGALAGYNPLAVHWVLGQDEPSPLPAPLADAPISQELAAQAALWLREGQGANLGVAVLGSGESDEGIYGQRSGQTYMAVAADPPHGVQSAHFPYGGRDELTAIWIGNRCLDLIRRQLV